jgi:hypothetical protein
MDQGYAFRCRNCNHLEEAGAAGERALPLKCRVCGAGAHFEIAPSGAPVLVPEPDNWIVLAELPAAQLKPILDYHGIEKAEIVAHVPFEPGIHPDHDSHVMDISASDLVATADKAVTS